MWESRASFSTSRSISTCGPRVASRRVCPVPRPAPAARVQQPRVGDHSAWDGKGWRWHPSALPEHFPPPGVPDSHCCNPSMDVRRPHSASTSRAAPSLRGPQECRPAAGQPWKPTPDRGACRGPSLAYAGCSCGWGSERGQRSWGEGGGSIRFEAADHGAVRGPRGLLGTLRKETRPTHLARPIPPSRGGWWPHLGGVVRDRSRGRRRRQQRRPWPTRPCRR